MRRVEKSVLWPVLMLTGVLGGCASMSESGSGAVADPVSKAAGSEPAAEALSKAVDTQSEVVAPSEPSPLAELAEARGAIDTAMTDIRMAEARGMLQAEGKAWLQQATRAVDAGDAAQARKLAEEASAQARAALDSYYTEMTQQRITLLRGKYSGKMSSTQRMRLDSAESALGAGKAEVALMLVSGLMDEVAPDATFAPPVTSDGKLTQVTVREGDTLSEIAARPDVYGNADLWPLLLKANRGKFLRVDELPVGIVLKIDRNATQAEIEHALAQAR